MFPLHSPPSTCWGRLMSSPPQTWGRAWLGTLMQGAAGEEGQVQWDGVCGGGKRDIISILGQDPLTEGNILYVGRS